MKFNLHFLETKQGDIPVVEWLENLDPKIQARIRNRFVRMENGNFGDTKLLQQGLYELRLFFGPGYRVYYGIINNKIVLLISGGDKKTQSRDIKKALVQWNNYQKENPDVSSKFSSLSS